MAVVKVTKKSDLDKLLANLTLRLGRKIQQQELIDACIRLGEIHFEELEAYFGKKPQISKKRAQEIRQAADAFEYDSNGTIDEDLYQ